METEPIFEKFEEIEQRIEILMNTKSALERENIDLKSRISRKESELANKSNSEQKYEKEKTLIRSKIDNILKKLKEIENIR